MAHFAPQIAVKATYMRGGTSKGTFFKLDDLPERCQTPGQARDSFLLRVVGSPDPYGKQIDGLGNGSSSTSKAVILSKTDVADHDVNYLFGQVAIDKAMIDWSGNCGNLTAAVGSFAIANGLVDANKVPQNGIAFVLVGPEAPLVAGMVDDLTKAGIKAWGPTAYCAQLEGSKAFAKDFMIQHHIPTAKYQTFSDAEQAIAYVKAEGAPIVIKADGLAAGKGVIVAMSEQEAIDAINDMLSGNKFGDAGSRVVIEQFLQGEEASFICMIDGNNILPMATSQDHKRIGDRK